MTSYEPLPDGAIPDPVGVWNRLATLEVQVAHQRTVVAALRAALRPALTLIERSLDQGTLLTLPWYRQGKQALNTRIEEDAEDEQPEPEQPACRHCGVVGGH